MVTAGGNERQWIEQAGGNKAWSVFSILRGEFAVFGWTMCRCFSACISFIVWAAACRTSALLCANLTSKKKNTHQAHFVWLIGFPPVSNSLTLSPRHIRQVWSSFDVIRRFQYLPNDYGRFSPLNGARQSSLLSQFNCFENQSRHREKDEFESWKKKRSFEGRSACDPGLVIVSDFLAEKSEEAPILSVMFFGEISEGCR